MTTNTPDLLKHRQRYSEAIREARLAGTDRFHSWFNASENVSQSIMRGHWDLTIHILTPKVCEFIDKPEQRIALEIGYGGGRILNAACSYFKEVIGIDIHDEQETVTNFLSTQGKSNFRLIRTSGKTIDVDSESIDFVYSFIVLQHLPSLDVFASYMKETYRCLKYGGIAQLYFAKWSKPSLSELWGYFHQGFKQMPNAPVNQISLVIRCSKVQRICRELRFRVIDTGTSYKQCPDGYPKVEGRQAYITLLKCAQ